MAGNFPDGSLSVFFNASVASSLQDRTLQRTFRDSLYPRLLFRMEAMPELWPINLGSNSTFTRTGLVAPTTRPTVAGFDPVPLTYAIEQWEATAQQWSGTIDTHMPTSYMTLASLFLRNVHQLGLHSGQSLNRIVRDKGFNAYVAGNTVSDTGAAIAATTIHVVNLNGFTRRLFNGRPQPVSAANPIAISFPATSQVANVTSFVSDIPGDEIHGGTLTFTPALATAVAVRDAVLATNRSVLQYSGGGNRVDDISAADQLRLADIRASVAQLRFDNVPTHEDNSYHVHLSPRAESQIFGDNEFQRLNQSIPDYIHYRRMAVAWLLGCTFYRNSESPTVATCSQDPANGFTTGFELLNPAGVNIERTIVTGQGWIEEKYLDEGRYISESGVQGKIGEFAITNGGVQVMNERIRLILRAPQDRLQQMVSSSWSFSGDWPVPSDETAPSGGATFKRASVILSGS